MARFFVEPQELNFDHIILVGENAQHAKVLRLKAGEEVLVCDGHGIECRCSVEAVTGGEVTLSVLEKRESVTEPRVKASIYMAFAKGDKLEHVIQKATELGAYEIVPVANARCVVKLDAKKEKSKLQRWQTIAEAAAKQSKRRYIPKVENVMTFGEALAYAKTMDVV